MMNDLVNLGRELSRFVVGAEGNVSKRTYNGLAIKASGGSLANMEIVQCDMNGTSVEDNNLRPSMETGFHSWIYRNSDFDYVAHTHPTNVLRVVCSDRLYGFATSRFFPDQVVFNGAAYCVVPYATPGSDLTAAMRSSASSFATRHGYFPDIFLLENHGLVTCANSPQRAVHMTEICEKAAEIYMGLDKIRHLTKEQVAAIQGHDGEIYRRGV